MRRGIYNNYKSKPKSKPNSGGDSLPPVVAFTLTEEYCKSILEKAYIGQQGFTILKTDIHPEDLKQLKQLLMIQSLPSFSGPKIEPISFPVFRENDKKIYIPRFYGESRYGNGSVLRNDLSLGDPIHTPFVKPIRDYQEKIIEVYINHIRKETKKSKTEKSGGGILEVPCGRGKCLGINTPILMYNGSIKLVQDIIVGDVLMGDDSTPRHVRTLARGQEQMYKIREKKDVYIDKEKCIGEEYIVNESHILSLYHPNTERITDISLTKYLLLPKSVQQTLFGYRVPIHFQQMPISKDPYFVGLLCESELKQIPMEYKCNSLQIQLEIFAGILDKNSSFYLPNLIKIEKQKEKIDDDLIFLSKSLGFKIYQTETKIFIQIDKTSLYIPFRKQENIERQKKSKDKHANINGNTNNAYPKYHKYEFIIEKLNIQEYYGFEIDNNRRFVLGDYTVTHNTVMALKIISIIERKTLILVHKEFLMNQWIERISEFMPNARVGKIQGSKFDIEEKDIVIGMIQSIYDRPFPSNAFSSFGLTIIDEVHRIASEEFSKTLFKTITNCMLGISATVDRKDGLTNILHMFIGPKIYSEDRKDEDVVEVRAIEYRNNDPEYNDVVYDYMGNVAHTTMISKISNFPPRCDFVVRILRDLIKENPENQIMVLSQIRGLLTDIHEKIGGDLEVGFYVGGMKQKDLQETEEKQIVLATYAMAAEALDIKTLNTLVMVSPKTDIIQSVGRILRTRGLGKLIVDIIDTHDVFQNQWKKRRVYYKKCGYGISYVKSNDYVNMIEGGWKRISNASVIIEENEKPKCLIDISKMDFSK